MGCVVYYVLSGGKHPFGSPFLRQANIEAGNYALNDLSGISKSGNIDCYMCGMVFWYVFKFVVCKIDGLICMFNLAVGRHPHYLSEKDRYGKPCLN